VHLHVWVLPRACATVARARQRACAPRHARVQARDRVRACAPMRGKTCACMHFCVRVCAHVSACACACECARGLREWSTYNRSCLLWFASSYIACAISHWQSLCARARVCQHGPPVRFFVSCQCVRHNLEDEAAEHTSRTEIVHGIGMCSNTCISPMMRRPCWPS
jgi:hypothetical protein